MSAASGEEPDKPQPRASIREVMKNPGFAALIAVKFLSQFSSEILIVAIAWQIYDITRDPLHLGFVGLVQFLPAAVLVMVTGAVADRFRRRSIMALMLLIEALAIGWLLVMALNGLESVLPIYGAIFIVAVARAFYWPAQQSLTPNLVPPAHLATAIAASSAVWQGASISAPVAGGLLYDWVGIEWTLAVALGLAALAALLVLPIPKAPRRVHVPEASLTAVVAGFQYIWKHKVVLGAISLDLFAVLLGGAVMLLPVYARDILDAGPEGLGLLRSASGVGALGMALWLAWRPIRDRAGLIMFACVIAFGLFTVVFGVSDILWVSVAALVIMGATDMVSVYVRGTLIQLRTPDELRGRVNAVNMVFIGASNELGAFRAGTMAAWIGTVPAVVVGGVGTVLVGGLWLYLFPQLRRERRLDGSGPGPGAEAGGAAKDPAPDDPARA